MARQVAAPEFPVLELQRWRRIVQFLIRRRGAAHRMDHRMYRALWSKLVAECRSAAASATEERQELFLDLEELLRPWLTPEALAQADCDILADLVTRCQGFERELGARPDSSVGKLLAPLAVVGAITAGVLLALLVGWCSWGALFVYLQSLGTTYPQVQQILSGLCVVLVVILVLILLVSRSRRT